jgi:hypothetical protein
MFFLRTKLPFAHFPELIVCLETTLSQKYSHKYTAFKDLYVTWVSEIPIVISTGSSPGFRLMLS